MTSHLKTWHWTKEKLRDKIYDLEEKIAMLEFVIKWNEDKEKGKP